MGRMLLWLREIVRRRGTRYGLNTALVLMLFLAIVVVVEALAIRHNVRVDLTEGRRHSLSDQSIKLLRSLENDVHAVAFYRTDEPGKAAAQDLLAQYAQISPKFRFEVVDPDRHPGMAKRYGITVTATVVVESGGKEEKFQGAEEEKITNALVKLLRKEKRVLYFVGGHGEASLESSGRQGLSLVKEALTKVDYEVRPLVLLREREVPTDAAVLVIAGPQSDLLPTELQLIEAYVKRGGNLLVLLDPFTAPGLTDLLKKYGIVIGKDVIIDVDPVSRVVSGDYLLPVVTQYDQHPITKEFTKDAIVATILPYARTVDAVTEPPKGITVQVLARTSPGSWAETDKAGLDRGQARFDEGRDRQGPLPVAAVATVDVSAEGPGLRTEEVKTEKTVNGERSEVSEKKGRIVAYGTSAFMQNTYVNLAGNRDLLLNSVSWLAEEEQLIAIRPRQAKFTPLVLTANQARLAFWGILVLPPLAIIGTWVVVFLRRRRSA